MTSEADRLLSPGVPITVAGREERVRFSLLALKRCEDTYGSLAGTLDELRFLAGQVIQGFSEPVAERTARLLGCTLDGGLVDADQTPAECIEVLLAAWEESFPPADEGKAVGETTPAAAPRSPGRRGGASPAATAA